MSDAVPDPVPVQPVVAPQTGDPGAALFAGITGLRDGSSPDPPQLPLDPGQGLTIGDAAHEAAGVRLSFQQAFTFRILTPETVVGRIA
ncbi:MULTISPECIES: hypothetical protein [unclassified Streptomyces]|uniref:hypothetical protein n=1 Tax=unclassified Streptomyces TaxID=2593676 RepID=UPI003450F053